MTYPPERKAFSGQRRADSSPYAESQMPSFSSRLWISLLLFGLFYEWLRPMRIMGGEEAGHLFWIFTGLTGMLLLAGSFRIAAWLLPSTAVLSIAAILIHLYSNGQIWPWLAGFGPNLVQDAGIWAASGHMADISEQSRFLIILIGWISLVIAVQLLAIRKQTVLLFLLITTVYLLAFEIAESLDMFRPMVQALTLGLLLLFSCYAIRSRSWRTPSGKTQRMYTGNSAVVLRTHPAAIHREKAAPVLYRLFGGSQGLDPAAASNSAADPAEGPAVMSSLAAQLPAGQEKSGLFSSGRSMLLAGCAIFLFTLGSAVLARVLPVPPADPQQWQKAVSSLEAWADTGGKAIGSEKTAVSGYDGADDVLGAPLKMRKAIFFTAKSQVRTYWRGQSLSYYDGRGWSEPEASPPQERLADLSAAAAGEKEIIQSVRFAKPQSEPAPLFAGGTIIRLNRVDTDLDAHQKEGASGFRLVTGPETSASYIRPADGAKQIYGYELVMNPAEPAGFLLPDHEGTDRQEAELAEIRYRYLQLPASLPDSVRSLAKQLISDPGNPAKAADEVESYLTSRYTYSLDTSIPAEGQDFVADFLFRQKEGYCDHFSTAMVVLLRSQGIPARWVKGYAPGEQTAAGQYTVRYSDAHAWVEVYVPGKGWVTYDPTPGYAAAAAATSLQTETSAGWTLSSEWAKLRPLLAAFPGIAWIVITHKLPSLILTAVGSSLAVTVLAASVVYVPYRRKRKQHLAALSAKAEKSDLSMPASQSGQAASSRARGSRPADKRHLRFFPGRNELIAASDRAWAGLFKSCGPKPPEMTAKEYAEKLPSSLLNDRTGLDEFFEVWETMVYGGELPDRRTTRSFLRTCMKLAALKG